MDIVFIGFEYPIQQPNKECDEDDHRKDQVPVKAFYIL
jgi:hypothetical protein